MFKYAPQPIGLWGTYFWVDNDIINGITMLAAVGVDLNAEKEIENG